MIFGGKEALILVAGLAVGGIYGPNAIKTADKPQCAVSAAMGAEARKEGGKPYELNSDHPQFGFFDLDGGFDLQGWGAAAKAAVLIRLRDPLNANFSVLYAVGDKRIGKIFPIIVCGRVNAKNGSGGFTGDDPFVFYPSDDVLTIEKHSAAKEWNAYCAGEHVDPKNGSQRAEN